MQAIEAEPFGSAFFVSGGRRVIDWREVWEILGVDPTRDEAAIRRAYARRLKLTQPEDDPAGFQRLRAAYEAAQRHANAALWADDEDEADGDWPGFAANEAWPAAEAARAPEDPQIAIAREAAAEHWALLRRFDALVDEGASSEATLAALEALLASPGLEEISLYDITEIRVADLIAANLPHTGALVGPALARFGWDEVGYGVALEEALPIVDYAAEVRRLDGIAAHRGHRHNRALRLLRQGAPAGRPPRDDVRKVRAFLDSLRQDRPRALQALGPAALAAWQAEIDRPRLSAVAVWLLVVLPAPFGALAYMVGHHLHLLSSFWLGVLGGGIGMAPAAALTWTYGLDFPRTYWQRHFVGRAPAWLECGWAALALLSIAVAAVIPTTELADTLAWALAWIAAGWGVLVGQPDRRGAPGNLRNLALSNGRYDWRLRLILTAAPVVLLLYFLPPDLPDPRLGAMAFPIMLSACVFALGGGTMAQAWEGLPRGGRIASLVLLLAAVALAFTGLAFAAGRPAVATATCALVFILAIVYRPIVAVLEGPLMRARLWFTRLGILGAPVLAALIGWLDDKSVDSLRVGGLWLMTSAALALLAALLDEVRSPAGDDPFRD